MDAATYRKIDPETFRHKLSYHTRLANPPRTGLELSEAREAGQRTQRAGHIVLAKERPASYKKKANRIGRTIVLAYESGFMFQPTV